MYLWLWWLCVCVCVNIYSHKHTFAYIDVIALNSSICKGIRDKAVVRIGEEEEQSCTPWQKTEVEKDLSPFSFFGSIGNKACGSKILACYPPGKLSSQKKIRTRTASCSSTNPSTFGGQVSHASTLPHTSEDVWTATGPVSSVLSDTTPLTARETRILVQWWMCV